MRGTTLVHLSVHSYVNACSAAWLGSSGVMFTCWVDRLSPYADSLSKPSKLLIPSSLVWFHYTFRSKACKVLLRQNRRVRFLKAAVLESHPQNREQRHDHDRQVGAGRPGRYPHQGVFDQADPETVAQFHQVQHIDERTFFAYQQDVFRVFIFDVLACAKHHRKQQVIHPTRTIRYDQQGRKRHGRYKGKEHRQNDGRFYIDKLIDFDRIILARQLSGREEICHNYLRCSFYHARDKRGILMSLGSSRTNITSSNFH